MRGSGSRLFARHERSASEVGSSPDVVILLWE